ncbi:hypothetical protein [Sphingomonas sp.]|jgi:MYXO-CTERM domain-containing protein|uniref:hypothetical protein n=1 Tax=Sphingomonas sp. TaxID=28214 RepID=UPI002DD6A63A|nr:hypothetical protein [Sphingomonas sp.]
MKGILAALAAACAVFGLTGQAHAQVELKNDSFTDGQMVAVQGGFVPGEMAAARYQVTSPRQLLAVRTVFANVSAGGAAVDVTLHVWTDDGVSLAPGTELFSGDFTLTPSQTQMQELSVAADNITVSGWFRIGIEVHHTGQPSVTNDVGGFSNVNASLLRESTLGWRTASFFGVSGDWILRAVVSDAGGTPDAGTTGPDAGTTGPDAGTAGPDAGTGGTCNGNAECPVGQFCDTQVHSCTFECRTNDDCGGATCNSLGQCLAADGDSGGCCSTGTTTTGGMLGALGLAGAVGLLVTRRRRR